MCERVEVCMCERVEVCMSQALLGQCEQRAVPMRGMTSLVATAKKALRTFTWHRNVKTPRTQSIIAAAASVASDVEFTLASISTGDRDRRRKG